MFRLLAGIAGLSLLALPVVAQVRDGGDENSAMMADNEVMEAADAATVAAMSAAANAIALDNTVATDVDYDANSDTTYDANADMSMDTNMSDYVPPNYRFYRVSMTGEGQQRSTFYMDANNIRRTGGLVRGWERQYMSYQVEHYRLGTRSSNSLIEANCQQQQLHILTTILYNRAGAVLDTLDGTYSSWSYVAPDTVSESIYQFLCDDNRAFPGTFDTDVDARRTLPAERPARGIMTLPQQLRPARRRP